MMLKSPECLFAIFLHTIIPVQGRAATCGDITNPILLFATPVAFANYSAAETSNSTINGTLSIACTLQSTNKLPGFTISLSSGTAGSFSPRQMAFLGNKLNYNLYTTGSYTTIWGDGTSPTATQTYSAGSNLSEQDYTVFGSIVKNQYVPPGVYLDGITVTVTY